MYSSSTKTIESHSTRTHHPYYDLTSLVRSVIRLPLSVHACQYGVVVLLMVLLRVNAVAALLDVMLSSIFPSPMVDGITVVAQKYAPGWFKSLSVECWVVHMMTLAPGLEIVAWFRTAAAATASAAEKSPQQKNKGSWFLYQAFYVLFATSQIQGIVTILSHTMIDVNDSLEFQLLECYSFLMRLSVFATPFVILLPPLVRGGWTTVMGTVVPLLMVEIHQNILTFTSLPGIVTSSLAMMVVVSRPSRDLPLLFKLGWVLLALMPALFPDSSTDAGHTEGAAILNIPILLMAYGLHHHHQHHGRISISK
jgi:hypothetical protein